MHSSSCHEIPSMICILVLFSFLFSPIFSLKVFREENRTSMAGNQSMRMKLVNARLQKINKPFVKSIKSPDGDIIDCVLFHLQPAFDLPQIRDEISSIPSELLELPKGYVNEENNLEIKQLWNSKGELCPNGTIPIRRTTASDLILNSKSAGRRDIIPRSDEHEHAIGFIENRKFYGAKARLNVWQPYVADGDFSLSQIWVLGGSAPNMNTLEVGWQVYPRKYKDNLPRLFTYWTPNGYRSGCYNLQCSGFVQISHKFALGASIHPVSTYGGGQYDLPFMIWKGVNKGDWSLRVGNEMIGYWPKSLFTDLRDHATEIQYGGEVAYDNTVKHTTQMGSGHFQDEGFGKAAFARNLEVVNEKDTLESASNLNLFARKPNCYGVKSGYDSKWGSYIFFGGPGYNPNCH